MVVAYPFSIRKDTFETKTYDDNSIEALLSRLAIFFDTEEGEVEHIPDYGVKKRDLLFSADIDDALLGILTLRYQEKVNTWFSDVVVKDISPSTMGDNPPNGFKLIITVSYLEQDAQLEVTV